MKFAVIGGGWRSDFFLRVAQALPEFELCGIFRTTPEKAQKSQQEWGVFATSDLETLLLQQPAFVVLSVPRTAAPDILCRLMQRGIPVLCETPPAGDLDGLLALWKTQKETQGSILVAEQYFLQPYHNANLSLISSGVLGDVVSACNSMMHGYHGFNMLRRYLDVGMENCRITGKSFKFPITKTSARSGMIETGELFSPERDVFTLEFQNGKVGFWDFSGEQYHSYIRARHLLIQGTRGEICDTTVRYLTQGNAPVEDQLRRIETGKYSNMEGYSLRGLMLGENFVYRNPFEGVRLSDDEIAVAGLMRNMRRFIENDVPLCYSLQEALQDSYLALCLDRARETGVIQTCSQEWAR